MSEVEPHRHPKKEVEPRHIPQLVVPVPYDEVRDFVQDAVKGTSLVDPLPNLLAGFVFFEPHLRFTAVDETHTRIEIDVTQRIHGADLWLFKQRRGEIDRFFVALEDELARRQRWQK